MTAPNVLRPSPGGLRWNPALARYVGANGRIVSARLVRAALDRTVDSYKDTARLLADQLRAGTMSLRVWELEMERLVKDANLVSAAAAVGGWEQLRTNPRALGRSGRFIRDQYAFLQGFVQDVGSGKQPLDGFFTQRAVMYVEAGRAHYEAQRLVLDRAAGHDQERSIRHASDSCEGCIREERRGWVPIGSLVPVGDRNCLTRCRCEIERRMSEAAKRTQRGRRGPRVVQRRRPVST